MSTLFFLCLWVYSCISLDIVEEITACLDANNTADCTILLNPSISHTIHSELIDSNTSTSPNTLHVSITSSNTAQQASILVDNPLILNNYNLDITFDHVIIDGSQQNQSSNFLQINTNQKTQITINNSQIIGFNSSLSVIYIEENIDSFTVSKTDDTTITVDVVDIDKTNTFITINLENSVFTDNTNTQSNGGVLSLIGHEFQVYIDNCNFTNNEATAWRKNGGCISWDRSSLPDSLQSQLEDIKAQIEGAIRGPLYNNYNFSDGDSDIWTISSRLEITNSRFSSNYGADAGGVVYIIEPTAYDAQIFNIETSIEADNTTNISYTIKGNLSIIREFELYSENNIFNGNTAGQYGGVYRHWGYAEIEEEFSSKLMCDDAHYQITIIDDVFIDNRIEQKAGQSFAFGATLSSTCAKVTVKSADFTENAAKYGAAMSIYASSKVNIDDCAFIANNGTFGTVYINGLLDSDDGYDVNITNSKFIDNRADNAGAGILAIIVTDLMVDTCYFENNYNTFGGTVSVQYFQSFNPMRSEIINSQFIGNRVDSDDVVAGAAISGNRYDYGDDVYPLNCYEDNTGFDEDIQGLTLLIDLCEFKDNSESAIGLNVVSAYILRSKFMNNTNQITHGGAIKSSSSWFKVSDSQFISNNALQTGGAISTGIITYTNIYSNWMLPTGSDDQFCEIEIKSSVFEDNTADLGGAMFIGTMSVIEDNQFTNNNAKYGGAVAVSSSFMTILRNEFMNNAADTHGGCLFQTQYSNDDLSSVQDNVVFQLKDNTFTECSSYIGGAVFLRTQLNQEIDIGSNRFLYNYAQEVGGGLVIGQLLPVLLQHTTNIYSNNSADHGFDDYVSYPFEMYISSGVGGEYTVSPGISTSAGLGAYDLFGQDFESFMVTDWNTKEDNFEFYLANDERTSFELLTVNSGSLSAGQANISFVVRTGSKDDVAVTFLGSNTPNLVSKYNVSWALVQCPTGYGYNETTKTCGLCQRDTFKVLDGWTQCLPCIEGLSCRGGEHVQILHKNWWSSDYSDSKNTFFCRLGECCTRQDGCSPESSDRCPDDRDPESIGCGKCAEGRSAIHGSHICSDCSKLNSSQLYGGAIAAFILWPILLVFLFGLAKYDGDTETGNFCSSFYSVSIIEITIIVLIDYYQSLPSILTFVPDSGTYFLMNLFFARIPVTDNGLCLFNGMTILQKTYWDLLIPSIILILSFITFALSHLYNNKMATNSNGSETDSGESDTRKYTTSERINIFKLEWRNGWFEGWVYDPLRGIMFSLFFCIIPMLWSCSHLFKCIEYGDINRFWNAPGEQCQGYVVVIMALLFVALTSIYVAANIYYSNSHLLNHQDIQNNKRLIPLYLQRVQPFYFMVYPFRDKNTRRASKIDQSQNLTWQNITFRSKKNFKYLYVGWISPFLRKITCLLAHATITGAKGQSDQTFIVTNLTLASLVLYQLFSQDYTSIDNYTLHLYCMYLLYWLVLLIVSGSTKIISENFDTMQSLRTIVNVIMWIPFVCAVIAIGYAFLLLAKPEMLVRTPTERNKEAAEYAKAKTMNSAFSSQMSVISPDDHDLTKDNSVHL